MNNRDWLDEFQRRLDDIQPFVSPEEREQRQAEKTIFWFNVALFVLALVGFVGLPILAELGYM
jgi:hypothetical protein